MQYWLRILIILCLCWPLAGPTVEKPDHSTYVQHVEQGFKMLFQGNNKGAIAAFEAALAIEPEHYEILHYVGMVYASEEFGNKAVAAYQRSLALMPDNIEALYSLGVVYFKLKQWEDAVAPLQKVIKLSPEHARGHEALGKTYVKLRQYPEAVDILTRAITLNPSVVENYNQLGTAYLNLKAYPKAIENFKQAIKLSPPRYAEPHYGLGMAYLRSGNKEKSRAEMRIFQQLQKEFVEYERLARLTHTEPDNLQGWTDLAKLLMHQKDYGEAIQTLQKCIALGQQQNASKNNMSNFYHGMSQAFINLNYPKHAQEAASKAIQLTPNQAVLYNTLGSTYAMQGDVRNAIGAFQKAVTLDNEQPYYHLNLSKLYERLGNRKLAQEHYRAYEHFLSKQK